MHQAYYAQIPDVEAINNYRIGGYHPVHIDDTFRNGRYRVVHKLGHGTYSTVWLAKDASSGPSKYVSLKILAASASQWSGNDKDDELKVIDRLRSTSGSQAGKEHIMNVLDTFDHHGPNGIHHCIVTEVLGPSLTSDIEDLYPTEIFPVNVSKAFIRQVVHGLRYLHGKGIVHGDLHVGNLLLAIPNPSSLKSESDIETYLGELEKRPLRLIGNRDGTSLPPCSSPPHVPLYVMPRPDPTSLLHLCLDNPANASVKICDFSESSIIHDGNAEPRIHNMPNIYRAPELMFGKPSIPSPTTDIWALAVLIHFLFTGGATLFHSPSGNEDELLREMVLVHGRKLPEPTWSEWKNRNLFFDDEGRWAPADPNFPTIESLPWPRGRFLKIRNEVMDDAEELRLLEKMLKGMVALEPQDRATIDDVINSEWFTKYCHGA